MEIYFIIMIHIFWIRWGLPFKFFLYFLFGRPFVSTRCLPRVASGLVSL